jgi:para-aminobenzoate synthetase component I
VISIIRLEPGSSAFQHAQRNLGIDGQFRLDSGASPRPEWGRWTYVADKPKMLISCDARTQLTTLRAGPATGAGGHRREPARLVRQWEDPLQAIAWMAATATELPVEGGPPFQGGWIGYFGYDVGGLFESLPRRATADLEWPLFEFTFHDRLLAHDAVTQENFRVALSHTFPAEPLDLGRPGQLRPEAAISSTFSRGQFEQAVRRAVRYIHDGDVFQVNLSQRFSVGQSLEPTAAYRRLLDWTPASFGALLDYGDHALISNSPELFLRVEPLPGGRRRVVTRPIKGTRPRAPGMELELRDSAKDQAELAMIVDLERNDLGRVCELGSVEVIEPRVIEALPTVYHGVATIEGVLRPNVMLVDLLRAAFPSGSVTGAPKIRAMQIIDELEPVRRGPYCGAIGYISLAGVMEFNVAIRTMLVKDGRVHIPVGGGIVADSDPSAEYQETLVKARAMFAALGIEQLDH